MRVLHLNCGLLETPLGRGCCHCLAIVAEDHLALVDSGIGLQDCRYPEDRLGSELIDAAGFRFDEAQTAIRQLEGLGYSADQVTDIVLTHADPDHTGGLADFPRAAIHIATEELNAIRARDPRYTPSHFSHGPRWVEHHRGTATWRGIPVRSVMVCGGRQVHLLELFGHTAGHCGILIRQDDKWLLHAGDAYYLEAELDNPAHPVGALAEARAWNNVARLDTLELLRRLRSELGPELEITGYHDETELHRLTPYSASPPPAHSRSAG